MEVSSSLAIPSGAFYDGSRKFTWLSDWIGIPIDQVNFLVVQTTGLFFAFIFRIHFSPTKVSPTFRYAFSLVLGLILGYFCFGRQYMHLVGLPALCYVILAVSSPHISQSYCLAASIIYLSCMHITRQINDYGAYTIDITGPLMIIVQKVTSLAYSYHDGVAETPSNLSESQRKQTIKSLPSLLEYFSYVLNFQGIMAGPLLFYCEYRDFIEGSTLSVHDSKLNGSTHHQPADEGLLEAVIKKVSISVMFAFGLVFIAPHFPIDTLKDDKFVTDWSAPGKLIYCFLVTAMARWKYYHAWILADAICNASGLGFNPRTRKWDLISNVDVYRFELGTNMKETLDVWNIGTTRWLRFVVYDRAPCQKMMLTFGMSALWHGFYPGYYFTFIGGAFFTAAARIARRKVRPLFLGSAVLKRCYDMSTIFITRLVIVYITFSFVIMEFQASFRLYMSLYFFLHILGILVIVILPRLPSPGKSEKTN